MTTALRRVFAALVALFGCALFAGNLTVTIAPSQAVSNGAQWRVDGGSWRNSGATVRNLSNTTHQVEFKAISGWLAPAPTTATLTNGNTTSLSATYLRPAALSVTLTPASAQWRIDGGAWRNSGTIATGLTPEHHIIEYSTVAGYAAPVSETVSLPANQTTTLARSYTQFAQLTLTLSHPNGQWRVNGGTWQASGATVANLTPGSYAISYSTLTNYASPADETIALSAGQSLSLQRNYTALAQILIGVVPANGQWRVNGGGWLPSGTSLWVLPGNYLVEYSALTGYDSPATENLNLGAGGVFATTRYYTSTAPTLRVNLTPTGGQWRLDGGAWQASGTQLTELATGSHTIDYTDLGGDYNPLASETISLALRENATLTRAYPLKPATLAIALMPYTQMWRAIGPIDTGWFPSGINRPNMPPGNYAVTYQPLANYDAPPTETITLAPSQYLSIGRTYTPHPGQVTLTLTPATAQWRIYPDSTDTPSGTWQASGATLVDVPPRGYRVQYSSIPGYTPPSLSTLYVSPGQSYVASGTYTPIPPRILGNVTPYQARFRVNGGAWEMPDAWVTLPGPGSYQMEFSDVPNYQTPAPRNLTLAWGDSYPLDVAYVAVPPASLTVHTNPFGGSFRLNGGSWFASGFTLSGITAGTQLLEFGPWAGYVTPAPVTLTLAGGEQRVHTVDYVRGPASLRVDLTGGVGRWRVDGGAWLPGGTSVNLLSGPHAVEYEPVTNYVAPAAENFILEAEENRQLTRTYVLSTASVAVALTPGNGQWRIYAGSTPGGTWNASGTAVSGLAVGNYTIEYSSLAGYTAPPNEAIVLAAGDVRSLTRSYGLPGAGYADVVTLPDLGYLPYLIRAGDGMLYGVTNQGAGYTSGAFFRVHPNGTGFTMLRAFGASMGDPQLPTMIIEASDGFIYGTTSGGGGGVNKGAIFRSNRDGSDFTIVRTFQAASEGYAPNTLVEASDGLLYGTTGNGGLNDRGVVFRMSKSGAGYTVLTNLSPINVQGRNSSRLCESADGRLYATVSAGTSGGFGLIYRLNLDGSNLFVVKQFAGAADGATPRAPLKRASNGFLYGTTGSGGTSNKGTVFRLNADGTEHTILKHFLGDATEGGGPVCEFLEDINGVLYSATNSGGPGLRGSVFKMNADGTGYTTLKFFSGSATEGGSILGSPLVMGGGIISGASRAGGGGRDGVIFSLGVDGSNFTVVRHLGAPFGGTMMTPVAEATDGYLYGAALLGGVNGEGTVFKVKKDGSDLSVIRHFAADESPSYTQSVFQASDGKLYAACNTQIYRMNLDGTNLTVLRNFASDGTPQAIIEASDGILYGTTSGGGAGSVGHIFKINKDGTNYAVLRSFTGGTSDGKWPYSGVVEGPGGYLYGTTAAGGSADLGSIYRIAKDGSNYTVLKFFTVATSDGASPWSTPLVGSDGQIYGVTSAGGSANFGAIYKLAADGTGFTVLRSFLGAASGGDGSTPNYGGLIERGGQLYGITGGGGTFARGTLYRLNRDGSGYTIMFNFGAQPADACAPVGTLINSADGNFYGTAFRSAGGSVVYKFAP